MTSKFPVVSVNVMRQMFPRHHAEAEEIATNGMWFYSVQDEQFLSYVPNVNLCINDVAPPMYAVEKDQVNFTLRKYGSVYEVSLNNAFPSSFLLSSNLQETIEEYLDVDEDLHVAILNSLTTPIMLGSSKALERLLLASDADSYKLSSLKTFIQERN